MKIVKGLQLGYYCWPCSSCHLRLSNRPCCGFQLTLVVVVVVVVMSSWLFISWYHSPFLLPFFFCPLCQSIKHGLKLLLSVKRKCPKKRKEIFFCQTLETTHTHTHTHPEIIIIIIIPKKPHLSYTCIMNQK